MTTSDITKVIEQAQKNSGIPWIQLAKKMGVARNSIRSWMHGSTGFPVYGMLMLLHEFGLDVKIVKREEE